MTDCAETTWRDSFASVLEPDRHIWEPPAVGVCQDPSEVYWQTKGTSAAEAENPVHRPEYDLLIRTLPSPVDTRRSWGVLIHQVARVSSVPDENAINEHRLQVLKCDFSDRLVSTILDQDFEYGFLSDADRVVAEQMKVNACVTKQWLNDLFVTHFGNAPVLVGLLRVISRLDYCTIRPEGLLMTLAALKHKNAEVRECAVRAVEAWGTYEALSSLKHLHVQEAWLQEYIAAVVGNLEEAERVAARSEDQPRQMGTPS